MKASMIVVTTLTLAALSAGAAQDEKRDMTATVDGAHQFLPRKYIEPPAGYASFDREVRMTARYAFKDFDVECYVQANGPDSTQRVMMTVPKLLRGKRPAVVAPFYYPEAMLGFNPVDGSLETPILASQKTNLTNFAGISYLADLARRGYIAISADAYYRTYRPEGAPEDNWRKWAYAGAALTRDWPTWTGIGKLVFDTRLLIDMLEADVRVDASRIGIIGHSLGGKMAFYTGCLDPRVKVIVASDFGIGWDQTNWKDVWYWGDKVAEMKRAGIDHAQLLSLAGGKPFCLLAGQYDNMDSWAIMRRATGYENHPERLKIVNHQTGHRPPASATEEGYRFLDTVLKAGRP